MTIIQPSQDDLEREAIEEAERILANRESGEFSASVTIKAHILRTILTRATRAHD